MDDRMFRFTPAQKQLQTSVFWGYVDRGQPSIVERAEVESIRYSAIALAVNTPGRARQYYMEHQRGRMFRLVQCRAALHEETVRLVLGATRIPGVVDLAIGSTHAPGWFTVWPHTFDYLLSRMLPWADDGVHDVVRALADPPCVRLLSYARALARNPDLQAAMCAVGNLEILNIEDHGGPLSMGVDPAFFYSLPNSIMKPARDDVRFRVAYMRKRPNDILGPDLRLTGSSLIDMNCA